MNTFQKIFKTLIRYKVYYYRGRDWWGALIAPIGMITMFGVYRESNWISWFFKYPILSTIILFVSVVSGFVFVGYLDRKFTRKQEAIEGQRDNPILMEMYRKINELYETKIKEEKQTGDEQ